MNVFDKIEQRTTAEVVAMGFTWRLRSIRSADLSRLGTAQLLLIPASRDALAAIASLDAEAGPAEDDGEGEGEDAPDLTQDEQLAALQKQLNAIKRIGIKTIPQQKKIAEEIVAASVCAVYDATGDPPEWIPCTVVLEQAAEDMAKRKVWVGRLTEGIDVLSTAAFQLSAGGREAVKSLATFPEGA